MYLLEETYVVVAAFIQGYDEAYEGGLLAGFREWLVVRLVGGQNLAWPALVLHAAFPGSRSPQDALRSEPDGDRVAIDTLFRLLTEFDETRKKHDGLRSIFVAFEERG